MDWCETSLEMSEAADNLRGHVELFEGTPLDGKPNMGVIKEAGPDDFGLDERQGSRAVSLS